MNGGELQRQIIEVGHTFGWKFAHFRSIYNGRTKRWETPVGGDGQGFPDLVIVHPERGETYFREIKAQYEKLRPDQEKWGEWLTGGGADWAVWRPKMWDETIVPLLTFGRGRPQ